METCIRLPSLPVFYAIFQLLQEVKVQGIQLSNVEEDFLPSILGEDGSACLLGCLDGTMNYLGDREGGKRSEADLREPPTLS